MLFDSAHRSRLRRVALLLLLSMWFQTGFALGKAFTAEPGADTFTVVCRNGSLGFVSNGDADELTSSTVPCPVCAQAGDNDAPLRVHAMPLSERNAVWPDTRHAVDPHLATYALRPPARAPPLTL